MLVKIEKAQLLEGLNTVAKAITSKSTTPELQGVHLQARGNILMVQGTDRDMTIVKAVQAQVEVPGIVLVDNKIFSEVIRKLPNGEIELSIIEDNFLQIVCGKSQFKLVIMNESDYPSTPKMIKSEPMVIEQMQLKDMIRKTSFAVAQEGSRPILEGILFEIKDKKLTLVGLDGYRVALTSRAVEYSEDVDIVIPGKALVEISKLLKDSLEEVKIGFSTNMIMFNFNRSVIYLRLLEGKFVNYNSMLDGIQTNMKATVNTLGFLDAIDRATLMSRSENTNLVKLHVENEKVTFSSNSKMGKVREELECKTQGLEELTIAFNSRYIIEALRTIEEKEVEFNFGKSDKPVIINPANDSDTKYVVLPVRLQATN